MYFVSRQHYYYQDEYFVEIAYPSIDYSSPDMLICKYSGEGESYTDPREAVQVAIKIRDQWKEDLKGEDKDREISISYGSFDGCEGEESTDEELKAWADKVYESLEKCSYCGDILEKNTI